jgi:diaminohydroxyphosphoribosylaminopyrimidine deaminase/5-amino-6-(5-phosphoribosylamino)uracil reductase
MLKNDQYYMNLAIREALKGSDNTFPNPRVGAVVVADGEVISKGYHKSYGDPHAETIAIEKMKKSIENATLYVTLEPCAHTGKRGPCSEIIDPKVFSKVVIGTRDPNQIASGGLEQLLKRGIEVVESVCERECKSINRRFFTFYEQKRPYIILKMALTLDGFIAEENGKSKWITNDRSRNSVHKLRSSCDAILVGNRTVEKDNPSLTSHGKGKDPRVILFSKDFDKKLELKVFNQEPLIFDLEHSDNNPKKNIEKMLNYLYENSYQSLLVEGGGTTFTHFLNENIFDELQIFYAPKIIGTGIPFFKDKKNLEEDLGLKLDKIENFGNDVRLTFYRD